MTPVGVVMVTFAGVTAAGFFGWWLGALLRSRVGFKAFMRITGLSSFVIMVGLFGTLVGAFFWVAS